MSKCTCAKCGKTMEESGFYTNRDGTKTDLCKKCLTLHIDNFKPETFMWLLEKMDVPYIEAEWNVLRDKAFAKDPYKMNGMSVFGKYLSKMKLTQFRDLTWADTEKFKQQAEEDKAASEQKQAERQAKAEELKRQYNEGMISEAEYKTLTDTVVQNNDLPMFTPADAVGVNNNYREEQFLSEDELGDPAADLTHEDKLYLAMKWGRLYKPSEWVTLERNYIEMAESFDIKDPDTLSSLILLCKGLLKANQAIDCGDVDGFLKISRVNDSLRKSMKLTAAQNKEQKADFVDSVGELVAYCEAHGGQIPKHKIKVDYDIVDKVIRDLKDYTKSLVYNDLSLSRQIEDYLKKREIAEEMRRDREEAKAKGQDVQISDDEYQQHLERMDNERQVDQAEYYERDHYES